MFPYEDFRTMGFQPINVASATAPCDACDWVGPVRDLGPHPADEFPYDWYLCPACRGRSAHELLRAEVGR